MDAKSRIGPVQHGFDQSGGSGDRRAQIAAIDIVLLHRVGMLGEHGLAFLVHRERLRERHRTMHGHPSLAARPQHAVEFGERIRAHYFRYRVFNLNTLARHDLPHDRRLGVGIGRIATVDREMHRERALFEKVAPGHHDLRALLQSLEQRARVLHHLAERFHVSGEAAALHAHSL